MDLTWDPWVRTNPARIPHLDAVQGPVENVCGPCRRDQNRWLDAPAVIRPIRLITIGTYNTTTVAAAMSARAEDHYRRIRTQQELTSQACRRARHMRPNGV